MSKRIAHRNFDDTITSFLRHDDTESRVRTFADRSGRILDDTDWSLLPFFYHITSYGGRGDGQTATDASITSATAALTTTGDRFTASDVGKSIRVYGAGSSGADLLTTISAYVSPTEVTLADNASTTVSAKKIKWGTDNTEAFQDALQDIVDSGNSGNLYVPNGRYFVFGPLITSLDGVNPNCQIYIPKMEKANNTGLLSIRIVGESAPAVFGTVLSSTAAVLETGVIIESMIPGSGTRPRVFGTAYYNTGFVDTNSVHVIFQNIRIRVKSMTGTSNVASTMTQFGCKYMEAVEIYNCLADNETISWNSVEPTTNNVVGFELPNQASQDRITITNCMAKNCYYGFEMNEHVVASGLRADSCYYAYKIYGSGSGHSSLGVRLYANGCKNGILFDTAPNWKIVEFSSERQALTKWYDGVYDFVATGLTSNTQCEVTYAIWVAGGAGLGGTPTFNGSWEGYVQFDNMRANAFYKYAAISPAGDTPFHQLNYMGAVVAGDSSYPVDNRVHNVSGTANVAYQRNISNKSSAASDKRLLAESIRTNGSAGKGMQRISISNGTALAQVTELTTDYHKTLVPEVVDADITPAQITANTDNYAPTGIGTAATLRLSTDASRNITGIAAGTSMIDGRELTIINVGAQNIVLMNNVTSTAANRFLLNADLTILPEQAVRLVYDGTSSRWRKLY